jgi:hypothetical protein
MENWRIVPGALQVEVCAPNIFSEISAPRKRV